MVIEREYRREGCGLGQGAKSKVRKKKNSFNERYVNSDQDLLILDSSSHIRYILKLYLKQQQYSFKDSSEAFLKYDNLGCFFLYNKSLGDILMH